MTKKDDKGHVTYDSRKGDFVLGENVTPAYVWFNGKMKYTLLGDKVDKSKGVNPINRIEGSPGDGKSMIWPMKVMHGTQPFDPETRRGREATFIDSARRPASERAGDTGESPN